MFKFLTQMCVFIYSSVLEFVRKKNGFWHILVSKNLYTHVCTIVLHKYVLWHILVSPHLYTHVCSNVLFKVALSFVHTFVYNYFFPSRLGQFHLSFNWSPPDTHLCMVTWHILQCEIGFQWVSNDLFIIRKHVLLVSIFRK